MDFDDPRIPLNPKRWTIACEHVRRRDAALARVMVTVGEVELPQKRARFAALVSAVIGQQLSTKAAATIRRRVRIAAGGHLTAQRLRALDDATLQACGLSRQKLSYVRALCDAVLDDGLRLQSLHRVADEDVIKTLTRVRGIGVWSAQMFLMFTLRRPDVFPLDDLGIQNAIARLDKITQRPTKSELTLRAEAWRPYRSVACFYLWRFLDATPNGDA